MRSLISYDAEVMADEQVGDPGRLLQVLEQGQDSGLCRDIERARGLIADDHRWVQCERPGDGHALPLSPRELPRVPARGVSGQAYGVEQVPDPGTAALDPGSRKWLNQDVPDGHSRVQGGVRVLEDDLNISGQLASTRPRDTTDGVPAESHVSLADRCQTEDGATDRCLSGAGLSDQAQGLPWGQVEGHTVDDGDRGTPAPWEPDHEVLDLQQGAPLVSDADAAGVATIRTPSVRRVGTRPAAPACRPLVGR